MKNKRDVGKDIGFHVDLKKPVKGKLIQTSSFYESLNFLQMAKLLGNKKRNKK